MPIPLNITPCAPNPPKKLAPVPLDTKKSYESAPKSFSSMVSDAQDTSNKINEKADMASNNISNEPPSDLAKKDAPVNQSDQKATDSAKKPESNNDNTVTKKDEERPTQKESLSEMASDSTKEKPRAIKVKTDLNKTLKKDTKVKTEVVKGSPQKKNDPLPSSLAQKVATKNEKTLDATDSEKKISKKSDKKSAPSTPQKDVSEKLDFTKAALVQNSQNLDSKVATKIAQDKFALKKADKPSLKKSEEVDALVSLTSSVELTQKKADRISFLDKDKKIKVTDKRDPVQSQKATAKILDSKINNKGELQLTLDLNAGEAGKASSGTQILGKGDIVAQNTFSELLSSQLQESAPDFVRAGNIILRDNDAGEIKLLLHPDSLGDVKIDLQLSDKALSGKIVVATKAAFDAFSNSSASLKEAFVASGFESADFDLSFAGGNAQNNSQNEAHQSHNFTRLNNILGEVAETFPDNLNGESLSTFEGARKSINMVA